jgi:hypothetical protein
VSKSGNVSFLVLRRRIRAKARGSLLCKGGLGWISKGDLKIHNNLLFTLFIESEIKNKLICFLWANNEVF